MISFEKLDWINLYCCWTISGIIEWSAGDISGTIEAAVK